MAGFELRDRRPESAGHHGASRATQSDGTASVLPRISATLSASASNVNGLVRSCVPGDRKSTRLNSSHLVISYAVFCLKKKNRIRQLSGMLVCHTVMCVMSEPD